MYLYVLDVRVCVISVRLFAVHAAYESCRVSVYAVSVRVALCASVFSVLCVYIYCICICNVRRGMHPQ